MPYPRVYHFPLVLGYNFVSSLTTLNHNNESVILAFHEIILLDDFINHRIGFDTKRTTTIRFWKFLWQGDIRKEFLKLLIKIHRTRIIIINLTDDCPFGNSVLLIEFIFLTILEQNVHSIAFSLTNYFALNQGNGTAKSKYNGSLLQCNHYTKIVLFFFD